MASQFTTAARIKAHVGIPAGVTQHDARIGYAVAAVDSILLPLLGLDPISGSVTQQWYSDHIDVAEPNEDRVALSHYPVVAGSVAGVTNDGTLLAATDWYSRDKVGEIVLTGDGSFFAEGKRKVVVTYQAGYVSVPGALSLAGDAIGAWVFNQLPKAGFESEGVGEYRYTAKGGTSASDGDLPPLIRRLIAGYRRAGTR
jgi:hypothetical protein